MIAKVLSVPQSTSTKSVRLYWQLASASSLRETCYALRASEYGRYYDNIPDAGFCDRFDELSGPDGKSLAHTIAIFDGDEVVATVRLVEAYVPQESKYASELGELTTIRWSDLAAERGIATSALRVGELGKYAVSVECRAALQAKWLLLVATGFLARQLGINTVVAIMTPPVRRVARRMGFPFHPCDRVALRRSDPKVRRTMLRHHEYFLPTLQKKYSREELRRFPLLSDNETRRVMHELADGPRCWWITPDELVHTPRPTEAV